MSTLKDACQDGGCEYCDPSDHYTFSVFVDGADTAPAQADSYYGLPHMRGQQQEWSGKDEDGSSSKAEAECRKVAREALRLTGAKLALILYRRGDDYQWDPIAYEVGL